MAIVDVAEVSHPIVVGLGFGGYVALWVALEHPGFFAGLSLWSVDAAAARMVEIQSMDPVLRATRGMSVRAATTMVKPLLTRAETRRRDPYALAIYERSLTTLSPSAMGDIGAIFIGRPNLRPRLGEIGFPTQVLWGDRDRLVRQRAGTELLQGISGSTGGPIAGATHLLHLDQPGLVNEALLRWLAETMGSLR